MKPLEQRFWAKVIKSDNCWLWTGAKNLQGYGKIGKGRAGDGFIATHRLSYQLAYGEIPEGKCVLHRCDNPACVRPDHFFIGTQTDNLEDMTNKGHRRFRAHRGEDNGRAKLTAEQVMRIRQRSLTGETRALLARLFNVSWSTIDRIVKGIRWQCLQEGG